jgi:integrase
MTYRQRQKRWVKKANGNIYTIGVQQLATLFPDKVTSFDERGTVYAANHWWHLTYSQLNGSSEPKMVSFQTIPSPTTSVEHIPSSTVPSLTINEAIKHFQQSQLKLAHAGKTTLGTYKQKEVHLKALQRLLNCKEDVATIDNAWLLKLHDKLIDDKIAKASSGAYQGNVMKYALQFVRWLAMSDKIKRPTILDEKGGLSIPTEDREPEAMPVEVFNMLIAKAPERLKLYLLLMLNCGMYQSDISDLKQSEVDWQKGTITRYRSKVSKNRSQKATARKVTYLLWKDTMTLLKKHKSDTERVLVDDKGNPLVNKNEIDKDTVADAFDRFRKEHFPDCKFPLKSIRKLGSTTLSQSERFAKYVGMYLSHRPSGVAEVHYLGTDQAGFAKAMAYLDGLRKSKE